MFSNTFRVSNITLELINTILDCVFEYIYIFLLKQICSKLGARFSEIYMRRYLGSPNHISTLILNKKEISCQWSVDKFCLLLKQN